MTDEPESLVLRLLQEIRATQVEHTQALSDIKDKLALQDLRLQNQSAMLEAATKTGSLSSGASCRERRAE